MKALVVSPYFKTLGGGERYTLTFAQALLDKNWSVDITLDDRNILTEAVKRFNLKLDGVRTIDLKEIFKNTSRQKDYDLIFWVSDGSIPQMAGKMNLLHFQIPFHDVNGKNIFNKIKFRSIDKVICNSFFTKNIIDKEYGISGDVWYPPVGVEEFSSGEKKNYILAVGRFEKSMTEKRQDILIEAFKKMVKQGLRDWKLVLSGGCTEVNNSYLGSLRESAGNFPIEFKINVPFKELRSLYAEATIFWHAAGYGVDEEKYPEKVEHFGITTVEAMASGCVPVVINKGGQKEIIENGQDGFLWNTVEELKNFTLNIIEDDKLWNSLSAQAVKKSRDFSEDKFYEKVYELISKH